MRDNRWKVDPERPVRFGVLGASRIVDKALLQPASGLVEVRAVGARDLPRARAFAAAAGIPRAYGSYEELVCDPEIDAVYVALPASGHAPWAIRALTEKKHVLCEKPFSLDAEEARETVRVADQNGCLLMEAHHWRYHPLLPAFAESVMCLEGPFQIEAVFRGGLNRPEDIRLDPLLGPGVLMDFGCYLIQWARHAASLCDSEWKRCSVLSSEIICGAPEVDLAAQVELKFGKVTAAVECDMRDQVPFQAYVRVLGRNGVVHFESPLVGVGARLEVQIGAETRSQVCPGPSTYQGQLEAFLEALRTGNPPPTSGDDIIETQELLDAIYVASGLSTRRQLRDDTLRQLENAWNAPR